MAAVFISAILTAIGCKKDKVRPEYALRITTDASTMTLTPGPDYEFNLIIGSAIPEGGVWIRVAVL